MPAADSAPPRLIALDLDGTLLRSDKRISARSLAAVRRLSARGVAVLLCTGRPPRSAKAYAAELGLDTPFICYNGAAVYDPARDAVTVRHHLDPETALAAIDRLRATFPSVMLALESASGWYLEAAAVQRGRGEARLGPEAPTGVGPVERFVAADAIKLMAFVDGHNAAELARAVGDLPLQRTWSAGGLLELLDPRVDKRNALADVCAERGVARTAVAAFGDQRNDVEMLAWAGLGVAVANACDEAKAAADVVVDSNDADGVAGLLERWLGAPEGDRTHQAPTRG